MRTSSACLSSLTLLLPLSVGILLLPGCGGDKLHRIDPPGPPRLPTSVFRIVSRVDLEEGDSVINVTVTASLDGDSGFLVGDVSDRRVRLYGRDGRLRRQFGRPGQGPGEFSAPMTPVRMSSGDVVVVDMMRGLMTFDESGRHLRQAQPPLRPLVGVREIDDSTLLVAGVGSRGSPADGYLLHLLDRTDQEIRRSFFPLPRDSITARVGRAIAWVGFDIRGDTVAAAYATTDTLYFFSLAGIPLDSVALPFGNFRRGGALPQERTVEALQRWAAGLDRIGTVTWLPDGSLVVQADRRVGAEHEYTLLHVTRTGSLIHETVGTPRLLANDGDLLYFLNPASETEDKWLAARYLR